MPDTFPYSQSKYKLLVRLNAAGRWLALRVSGSALVSTVEETLAGTTSHGQQMINFLLAALALGAWKILVQMQRRIENRKPLDLNQP